MVIVGNYSSRFEKRQKRLAKSFKKGNQRMKFAWLPVVTDDFSIVWLEKVRLYTGVFWNGSSFVKEPKRYYRIY